MHGRAVSAPVKPTRTRARNQRPNGAFELMPDLCDLCDLSATVPVLDCVATPPAYVSRLTPGSPEVFLNQSVVIAHWVQEGA